MTCRWGADFLLLSWRVLLSSTLYRGGWYHVPSRAAIQVVRASLPLKETVALKLPPEMPLSQLTVKTSDLQLNYGKSK